MRWWHSTSIVALRYPFFLSAALGIAAALLPPAIFGWWYDTNDDVFLRSIVEGVFSSDRDLNTYLIFSHHYLGYFFRALYEAAPRVPWYDTFQTLSIAFAFVAAFFSLIRLAPTRITLFIAVTTLFSFAIAISVRHQFTIIATIVSGSGLALFVSTAVSPAWSRAAQLCMYCAAFMLVIQGSFIRFESFALVSLAALPSLALFFLWRELGPRHLFAVAALVATCFVLHRVDQAAYNSNPEWVNFIDHNRERTNLTEYLQEAPSREMYNGMRSAGFSENDRILMSFSYFSNVNIFGEERLSKIRLMTLEKKEGMAKIKALLSQGIRQIKESSRYILPFLLVTCACLFWERAAISLLLLIGSFGLIALTAVIYKPVPFRVSHGFFFVATLFVLITTMRCSLSGNLKFRFNDFLAVTLIVSGFVGSTLLLSQAILVHSRWQAEALLNERFAGRDFSILGTNRILIIGAALPYEYLFRPFGKIDELKRENVRMSAWIDQTPFQQRRLSPGEDLLFNSCQDGKTEIVVGGLLLPILRRYISEHFSVFPEFAKQERLSSIPNYRCRIRSHNSPM